MTEGEQDKRARGLGIRLEVARQATIAAHPRDSPPLDPADYRAVLASIAGGMTGITTIAQRAGFEDRPHVVRRALAVLEGLDLIARERNFAAPTRAPMNSRGAALRMTTYG